MVYVVVPENPCVGNVFEEMAVFFELDDALAFKRERADESELRRRDLDVQVLALEPGRWYDGWPGPERVAGDK